MSAIDGENETTRLNKIKFLEALSAKRGIVSRAAEAVNLDRTNHYKWLKDDPEYAENVMLIDEELCDFYEGKFIDRVEADSDPCILHGVKTKARKRGYGEVQKVELAGGIDANVGLPKETIDAAIDQIYERREAELEKQKAEAEAKPEPDKEEKKPDEQPGH